MGSFDRALDTGDHGRQRGLRLHRDDRDPALLRDGGANGDRVGASVGRPALLDPGLHGAKAVDELGSGERGSGNLDCGEGPLLRSGSPLAVLPTRIRICDFSHGFRRNGLRARRRGGLSGNRPRSGVASPIPSCGCPTDADDSNYQPGPHASIVPGRAPPVERRARRFYGMWRAGAAFPNPPLVAT
jgi:hypothetical protein